MSRKYLDRIFASNIIGSAFIQSLQKMPEIFDFDQIVDRRNTDASKWEKYKGTDILPLWVADSDFAVAPAIQQALNQRVAHDVYGYTETPERLIELIVDRMKQRYDWEIDPSWLIFLPGVVNGMNCACRSIGEPGDSVYTPSVVYPPITEAPANSDRITRPIPMAWTDGRMVMDFEWLKHNPDARGKLLLLCNPHNPGGAMYREAELAQLTEVAIAQDLVICSDEIHCELILDTEKPHIPIGSIEALADRSMTLMAPSKTFNLAGLSFAFAIVPNRKLRMGLLKAKKGIVPYNGLFGYIAAQAAYESGDEWNRQQCTYLAKNRDYLLQHINQIRGLSLGPVEATYLAWIDVSRLKLEDAPTFFENAGVGMSAGIEFGDNDRMRFNFACPYATVVEAVARIRRAVSQLNG
ncbi:MAG: PatB family C-S lyase [Pseudomonadota bacterium]